MTFSAVAMAISLLVQSPGPQAIPPAQDPGASAPTTLSDVLVEGVRLRSVVENFVGEVAAPATGDRGPARWNGPVCIGVVNLKADVAQFIVDRASDVARELGLSAGEPGCSPNVLIIAAADGRAVADGIVGARRRTFSPGGSGMTRSLRALEAFRTSDAPIRWWHVSGPVDSETGQLATRLPGEEAPQTAVSRASRLRTDIRDDMFRVVIVVDITRTANLTWSQLADYCSLIALAQIDPEADLAAYDTILNLFEDQSVAALTSWDMDYLHALYRIEQNRLASGARRGELTDLMLRGLRVTVDEGDED